MTTFSSRIRLSLAGVAVSAAFFPGFAAAADDVNVEIETNLGTITLRLDAARAPVTVKNFTNYAKAGFYDGTIFHRVIDGFMIQGGGFTPDMKQKETHDPIENEAANGLKNDKYTIAMARTSYPHSATSQFFINTTDNDFLNYTMPSPQGWGYAVFGKVVTGMDVIDAIGKVRTSRRGMFSDVPVEDVVIEKVEMI